MKKSTLISAVLLANPSAYTAASIAAAMALSQEARADLLQQSFQSDATFTGNYTPESRLLIQFAKLREDYLPATDVDVDFEVLVKAYEVESGAMNDDGFFYYAKSTGNPGQFKLYNCDSTRTCDADKWTLVTITEAEGQAKLQIEDAGSIYFSSYLFDIDDKNISFSEVK